MVNTEIEELKETNAQSLPPASLETLMALRNEACSSASQEFKLQPNQRFLRRVLSPDSPTRNMLLVHGTGSGKTCTAIQIAEEYIIRPEFQDKRVLVLANPSIQENFKTQIFDISRVNVDEDGILMSQQCTGRRYLDILKRSQSENLNFTNKEAQVRIMKLASKLINEFYEFQGYTEFSNTLKSQSDKEYKKWVHDTFDNRLIIVDEAHNLRDTANDEKSKLVSNAIKNILQEANGVTFVLLTATPMYDSSDEILFYFSLFLWNDRKLDKKKIISASDIFDKDNNFLEGKEAQFRGWCQDYVSFIKGQNPFTFPFNVPPPDKLIAEIDRETDINDEPITNPRKYLSLTKSIVSEFQKKAIFKLKVTPTTDSNLICAYPENKPFKDTFVFAEGYSYTGEKFLAPSKIATYSSKFALIMNILKSSTGIVFVYSNLVENGANTFAMCLEEHGYKNALGKNLLKNPAGELENEGNYIMLTNLSDADLKKGLTKVRSRDNLNGELIRVIVGSPKVAEGIDFRYVRQIHILDPWFNMSRIEQTIGRGMRTCSHSLLPFEDQNCTVYLHICRYGDVKKETVDEHIYREFVEKKAVSIAKVKQIIMESAIDCELQQNINNLPPEWNSFTIQQTRSQDKKVLNLTIKQMASPQFIAEKEFSCKVTKSEPIEHERPISTILDARDEILDKLLKLFAKKSIWKKVDLFSHPSMKQYSESVLSYILQTAIDSGFQVKDSNGRKGFLQAKEDVFSFIINEHDTMLDRTIKEFKGNTVTLPIVEEVKVVSQTVPDYKEHDWKHDVSKFSPEVLEWQFVDTVLTKDEKITHLLNLDWSDPPIYAKPLIAAGEVTLFILGKDEVYNGKTKITPIGQTKDLYEKWLKDTVDDFIAKKDDIYATIKEQNLTLEFEIKDSVAKRIIKQKTLGGKSCKSYMAKEVEALTTFLGIDALTGNKDDKCFYLGLYIRKAILEGKEGLFWVTPEVFEIISDKTVNEQIRSRLK